MRTESSDAAPVRRRAVAVGDRARTRARDARPRAASGSSSSAPARDCPGIVAASLGARVVQTDRQNLVLHVCKLNAAAQRRDDDRAPHRRLDGVGRHRALRPDHRVGHPLRRAAASAAAAHLRDEPRAERNAAAAGSVPRDQLRAARTRCRRTVGASRSTSGRSGSRHRHARSACSRWLDDSGASVGFAPASTTHRDERLRPLVDVDALVVRLRRRDLLPPRRILHRRGLAVLEVLAVAAVRLTARRTCTARRRLRSTSPRTRIRFVPSRYSISRRKYSNSRLRK